MFLEHGHPASEKSRHGPHRIVELSSGLQFDSLEDVAEQYGIRSRSAFVELHDDIAASGHELVAVCGDRRE